MFPKVVTVKVSRREVKGSFYPNRNKCNNLIFVYRDPEMSRFLFAVVLGHEFLHWAFDKLRLRKLNLLLDLKI